MVVCHRHKPVQYHGACHNSENITALCENVDTYYDFSGTLTDGYSCGFTVSNNKIVCIATMPYIYEIQGIAKGYSSKKGAVVTFGMFRNSEATPIDNGETTAKTGGGAGYFNQSILIPPLIINPGDSFYARPKSNTAGTDLTIVFFSVSIKRLMRGCPT